MRRLIALFFGLLALAACTQTPEKLPADNNRTYVVFFTTASAELDEAAQTVISQATKYATSFPEKKIYIEGYAQVKGDLSLDELVAIRRAQAVSAQFVVNGIDKSRILATPRAPEIRKSPVAARRVEIEIK
ncbi:MAG: OmpA family protein [Commensalibacter sp.]|nr:OmpA family protein [Commensalibacter sp.]